VDALIRAFNDCEMERFARLAREYKTKYLEHSSSNLLETENLNSNVMPSKSPNPTQQKKFHIPKGTAILIGNKNYELPLASLDNALNDVNALNNIFTEWGWTVHIFQDTTNASDLLNTISQISQNCARDETLLFYYSGHGCYLKDKQICNYMILVDSDITTSSKKIKETCLSLEGVRERVFKCRGAGATNIFIFDACRSIPKAKTFFNLEDGMVPIEADDCQETNTIIVLATGKGKVAYDNVDSNGPKNGVYNSCLIDILKDKDAISDLPITRVFELVAHKVMHHPRLAKKQRPWKTDSFEEDKFFIVSK